MTEMVKVDVGGCGCGCGPEERLTSLRARGRKWPASGW